jgi:hypothetical protein
MTPLSPLGSMAKTELEHVMVNDFVNFTWMGTTQIPGNHYFWVCLLEEINI